MNTRRGKRRVWPAEERQRIVAEAIAPNASVAAVALHHGVNTNLLFKWIRRSRQGWLDRRHTPRDATERAVAGPMGAFVPVEIIEGQAAAPTPLTAPRKKADRAASPARRRSQGRRHGAMEIALPNGARLSLDSDVDPETLRRILSALVDLRC